MTTLIITEDAFYSDSRVTAGGEILSDTYSKIFEHSGYIIAMTGNVCELKHHVIKYLEGEDVQHSTEGCCVVHKEGVTRHLRFSGGVIEDTVDTFLRCFGSGADWATAAMDFGKTPEEAIYYAISKDVYSGGKVVKVLLNKER